MVQAMERLSRIRSLSDSGRDAAVVAELGVLSAEELERSPALSLLFGIAQGRLGHHNAGKHWVARALGGARQQQDAATEARSLNVWGAIAFQEGRIDGAIQYFTEGLAEAERQGDRTTVGRCSNNLGIIANLRGDHGRAAGCYTMALAAFQHAGHRAGVAETLHNLAITYRDQRAYTRAFDTEERAAREAAAAGDLALVGLIHCGRGEIRLRTGDAQMGRAEIQRALELHREVGDLVGETEDLRALAEALDLLRQPVEAEEMLRDVVLRARQLARPLLAAQAERDLARMLHRQKRHSEGREMARYARERFAQLGAVFEVARLDGLLRDMSV